VTASVQPVGRGKRAFRQPSWRRSRSTVAAPRRMTAMRSVPLARWWETAMCADTFHTERRRRDVVLVQLFRAGLAARCRRGPSPRCAWAEFRGRNRSIARPEGSPSSPRAPRSSAIDAADVLDDAGLDALGGFHRARAGAVFITSARPMGELLLLAAGKVAAAAAEHGFQDREKARRSHRGFCVARRAAGRRKPVSRFFAHGQERKDVAGPAGRWRCRGRARLVGRQTGDVGTLPDDGPPR